MSGQVIRDVVVKIAVEMATSSVRMPSIQQGVEAQAKTAGEKAGAAYGQGFQQATAKIVKDPFYTPTGSHNYGPQRMAGSSQEVTDRLNALKRERVALEDIQPVLKRLQYSQQEAVATQKSYAASLDLSYGKLQKFAEGALTAARGMGLLGATADADATKWLNFAAKAQGALDIMASLNILRSGGGGAAAANVAGSVAGNSLGGTVVNEGSHLISGAVGGAAGGGGVAAARTWGQWARGGLGRGWAAGGGLATAAVAGVAAIAQGAPYLSDMYHGRTDRRHEDSLIGQMGMPSLDFDIAGGRTGNAAQLKSNAAFYRDNRRDYEDLMRRNQGVMGGISRDTQFGGLSPQVAIDRLHSMRGGQLQKLAGLNQNDQDSPDQIKLMAAAHQQIIHALQVEAGLHQQIGQSIDNQKQKINSLKDAVQQQQDQLKDFAGQFGRKDPFIQKRLLEIARGGGPKNEGEAKFVDQHGGSDQANKFFQQRGEAAGADEYADLTGRKKGLRSAEGKLFAEEENADLLSGGKGLEAAARESLQGLAKTVDIMKQFMTSLESLTDKVVELERSGKIKGIQQNRNQ